MSSVWALVPAKSPLRSKTRLNAIMQRDECASLSQAMLRDVLAALGAAKSVDAIAVLTDDDAVAAAAAAAGHTVVRDAANDLCATLDKAAAQLAKFGATTVLVMPADMPTITAADIDALVERHTGGLSLCPAIRDGGTNALLCSPPAAVPFCFGHNSAQKHLESAAARDVPHARLALPAFFRDIDLPNDLVWLTGQPAGTHTLAFLRQSGISARLGPAHMSASG